MEKEAEALREPPEGSDLTDAKKGPPARSGAADRRDKYIVKNATSHPEWRALIKRASYGNAGVEVGALVAMGLEKMDGMFPGEFERLERRFRVTEVPRQGQIMLLRERERDLLRVCRQVHSTERTVMIVAAAYAALELFRERSLQSFRFIAETLQVTWARPGVRKEILGRSAIPAERIERYMRDLDQLRKGYDDGSGISEIADLLNAMGFNARDVLNAANDATTFQEFILYTSLSNTLTR